MNRLLFFCLSFLLLTNQALSQTQAAGPVRYAGESYYEQAYDSIQAMLLGDKPASFERAVFLTEQAYLEGHLSQSAFEQQIQNLEDLCRAVIRDRQLQYPGADSVTMAQNAAIFTVLADTLPMLFGQDTVWNFPLEYDRSDFAGQRDWRSMFVSNLLETGTGNCHSLPYLYLMLAHRLDARAWLAVAPHHVYIKCHSEALGMYNVELTSGTFPEDAWLVASSYMHLDGILSGAYTDTLTNFEALALVLTDLAEGYRQKYGFGDGHFIEKTCSVVLSVDSVNLNARFLQLENRLHQWRSDPGDSLRQQQIQKEAVTIHRLGYRRMPESMYRQWWTEIQGVESTSETPDTLQPQPPPDSLLTLSGGKYLETFGHDSLIRISQVLLSRTSLRIETILPEDSLMGRYALTPSIISRWLSPDPLREEFPSWSPYNYVENRPVRLIDPSGLAGEDPFGPGYSGHHPVSRAIWGYNPFIWQAFEGSNNTSSIHFHMHAIGKAGPDARRKAYGAIGEGIVASRVASHVSETGSRYFVGRNQGGQHHDILQVTNLPVWNEGRFILKVNYTDIYGTPESSPISGFQSSAKRKGMISYEVKTINPKSDPASILKYFTQGVDQVSQRTQVADAGVLVFDFEAFRAVYNSPLNGQLMSQLDRLNGLKNGKGEQVGFMRLESDLYSDTQKSYHALKNSISTIPVVPEHE